ncbi:MAG: S-methyl-5'-thioinosine phosphorylase [Ectothiorhodospiraceae bacterium]|nr:S-methyl-5'-thioinosine phosphorylase [Chromatiales bacterium]MCP5155692.1 S-methyl-5'-thioinosine phosphorylase [Ectothiorhodospiraceae bacterium]
MATSTVGDPLPGRRLAIIGGTGLTSLEGLVIERREVVSTRWGEPSGPVSHGTLAGKSVAFLPRHGYRHTIPPHRVNYRANIWALRTIGITHVVAVAAVGGIDAALEPGCLVVPSQIVDYTWSRGHSFFEDELDHVVHIDFTEPYESELRGLVLEAGRGAGVALTDGGTYAAMQGPRLETAAEIDRLERDGCTLVGMTGMPEAALAREAGLAYAHLAVVVNPAAGRGEGPITMEQIEGHLRAGMGRVRAVLEQVVRLV